MKEIINSFRGNLVKLSKGFENLPNDRFEDIANRPELEDEMSSTYQDFQQDFDDEVGVLMKTRKEKAEAARKEMFKLGNSPVAEKSYKQLEEIAKSKHDQKIKVVDANIHKQEGKLGTSEAKAKDLCFKMTVVTELYKPRWYDTLALGTLLSLLLVSFGEAQMTKLAMEITGAGNLETWIMSIVIGFAIAIMAHFAGIVLHKLYKGDSNKITNSILFVSFSTILVVSYVMGNYRFKMAAENGNDSTTVWEMASLNFALYMCAVLIVFLHKYFEKGTKEQKRSYKSLHKIYENDFNKLESLKKEKETIEKDYFNELERAQAEYISHIDTNKAFGREDTASTLNHAQQKVDIEEKEYEIVKLAYMNFSQEIHQTYAESLQAARQRFEDQSGQDIPRKPVRKLNLAFQGIMSFLLLLCFTSCSEIESKEYAIGIMYDISEKDHHVDRYLQVETEKDGEDLLGVLIYYDKKDDESIYHYGKISFKSVNSDNNNRDYTVTIKEGDSGLIEGNNRDRRILMKGKVPEIIEANKKALAVKRGSENTNIYIPFCKMAKKLAKLEAHTTKIFLFTDGMESDVISFYENLALLSQDPDKVKEMLTKKGGELPDLSGITVYLIYNSGYDQTIDEKGNDLSGTRDDHFTIASKFWEKIFLDAGADEVIIDSSLEI